MDCLKGMRKIEDNSVDLVVTSPPYNLNGMRKGSYYAGKKKGKVLRYKTYDDNMPYKEYEIWQRQVLMECYRVIKNTGAIFYNHKPRIKNFVLDNRYSLFPLPVRQEIIWYRKGGVNFNGGFFLPNTERLYLFAKKDFKINKEYIKLGEVWEINFDINTDHPAPFPVELPEKCILSSTNEGDVILDPFMGSGSTALACKKLNRKFIGFEICKEYYSMSLQKLVNQPLRIESWVT